MSDVSFYPPITEPIVRKKRDGFLVTGLDGSCDFLDFHEGLIWRVSRRLPARFYRERRRSEAERHAIAREKSRHLPDPNAWKTTHWSDDDLEAMRAAFAARFDEPIPRTESLMMVAAIGYRIAMQDLQEQT